jgi:hypothetical protein
MCRVEPAGGAVQELYSCAVDALSMTQWQTCQFVNLHTAHKAAGAVGLHQSLHKH